MSMSSAAPSHQTLSEPSSPHVSTTPPPDAPFHNSAMAAPTSNPSAPSTTMPPTSQPSQSPTSRVVSDPPLPHLQQPTTEQATRLLETSLLTLGTHATQPLLARSADIHANSNALASQMSSLDQATASLAATNKELEKLVKDGSDGLKEVGDVQNWAEMLERELLVLEEVDRIVGEEQRGLGGDEEVGRNGKGKKKRGWWFWGGIRGLSSWELESTIVE